MNDERIVEVDLLQVVKFVWARKVAVILITVLVAVMVVGASFLLTPIYQARVVLAPVTSDMSATNTSGIASQLGGLASVVGVGGAGVADESTVHMAIFESRKFIREFIEENDLITTIYADRWNDQNNTWDGEEPTIWKAVNYFDSEVRTISVNQETGMVTLMIDWPDAELAVKWAELNVERINKVLLDDFIADVQRNLEYLNEQLLVTQNSEMRAVLYSLIQEQIKDQMLSSNSIYFAYKIVDPAVVPDEAVRPKKILFALAGIFLGGLMGIIYAWSKGHEDQRRKADEN